MYQDVIKVVFYKGTYKIKHNDFCADAETVTNEGGDTFARELALIFENINVTFHIRSCN